VSTVKIIKEYQAKIADLEFRIGCLKAEHKEREKQLTEQRDISKLAVDLSTPWEKAIMADAAEKVKKAEARAEKAEKERDQLAAWKKEALMVEAQWDCQSVAKLLGMPLGVDVRKNIEPAIRALKARVAKLNNALRKVWFTDDLPKHLEELIEPLLEDQTPAPLKGNECCWEGCTAQRLENYDYCMLHLLESRKGAK
jgi:hypothetical protein